MFSFLKSHLYMSHKNRFKVLNLRALLSLLLKGKPALNVFDISFAFFFAVLCTICNDNLGRIKNNLWLTARLSWEKLINVAEKRQLLPPSSISRLPSFIFVGTIHAYQSTLFYSRLCPCPRNPLPLEICWFIISSHIGFLLVQDNSVVCIFSSPYFWSNNMVSLFV